jgi:hypothetical protein
MKPPTHQQPIEAKTWGPVQRQLLLELEAEFGFDFSISLSNRSPFGKRAFRAQLYEFQSCDCAPDYKSIANALRQKAWVEAASSTPANIYVRPTLEAMRSWRLLELPATNTLNLDRNNELVLVRLPRINHLDNEPLRMCRIEVIARAVVSLLRWTGTRAMLSTMCVTGQSAGNDRAREVTVGICSEGDTDNLAVGSVDIQQGALRFRCGGSIGIDDLRSIICTEIVNPSEGRWWQSDIDPDCALAFIFARAERKRHLRINQTRLTSELAAYTSIIQASKLLTIDLSEKQPLCNDKTVNAVGEVVLELELLPWIAEQAISAFEPAIVLRYLVNLARRARDASSCLAGDKTLSAAVEHAIALGLSLSGCGDPVLNEAVHSET